MRPHKLFAALDGQWLNFPLFYIFLAEKNWFDTLVGTISDDSVVFYAYIFMLQPQRNDVENKPLDVYTGAFLFVFTSLLISDRFWLPGTLVLFWWRAERFAAKSPSPQFPAGIGAGTLVWIDAACNKWILLSIGTPSC
jgi:hypothetical protein